MSDLVSLQSIKLGSPTETKVNAAAGATDLSKQFGTMLGDAIEQLNAQQDQVDILNQQFITGDLADIHRLTIASEQALLGLQLTVQIRNKVIEAYQEMMRMQV